MPAVRSPCFRNLYRLRSWHRKWHQGSAMKSSLNACLCVREAMPNATNAHHYFRLRLDSCAQSFQFKTGELGWTVSPWYVCGHWLLSGKFSCQSYCHLTHSTQPKYPFEDVWGSRSAVSTFLCLITALWISVHPLFTLPAEMPAESKHHLSGSRAG